jgi:outer membrane immunogenic protein
MAMHIRLASLLGAAIGLALGQSAVAADLPVRPVYKAPVAVVPPFSWTGFYIGGHIGGSWANVDWTHTNNGGIVEVFEQDASSFIYGGHAGFMYQFSNIVVGVEGTYSRNDDLSEATVAALTADRSNAFRITNQATVVGRLGVAWDRWLVYGQGGWATADIDFQRFVTSTGAITASSSGWEDGWTVGVGTAYAVHNNVILGLEYNFIRIDLDNRAQVLAPGFAGLDTVTNAKADMHQVTGRLTFKFP